MRSPSSGSLEWLWPPAVLFLAYSALTIWWLWPAPLSWSDHAAYETAGFGDLNVADFYLNVWTLTWGAKGLVRAPLSIFDANAFYPATNSLAYSEHLLGFAPLFAPIYWATKNPILSYNVTSALTYPLCALCTYLYASQYMSRPAAALSGFFFAFAPFRAATPPHIQVLGAQYLPLILLATDRIAAGARWRDVGLLAASLTLQATTSAYLMYAIPIMLLPYVVLRALMPPGMDRRALGRLAVGGVVAVGAVLVVMTPYLRLRSYGLIASYDGSLSSMGLYPVFARIALFDWFVHRSVGLVGYALAVVGITIGRPYGRWIRIAGLTLGIMGSLAALGPKIALWGQHFPNPLAEAMSVVPGFATLRAPIRFSVIAHLGLSLLSGLGAEFIRRWLSAPVSWVLSAGTAAVAVLLMTPIPNPPLHQIDTGDAVPEVYRRLAREDHHAAILEVPRAVDLSSESRRVYYSLFHEHPIVGGYAGNGPRHADYLQWIAQRLPADAALQELVDLVDIGWIVVHRDELADGQRESWDRGLPPGLALAGAWGDTSLYRVTRGVQNDHRARLLSTSETLNGVPIRAVGADCSLDVSPVSWIRPPSAGEYARAEVTISNSGGETLPALGFYPAGLIALQATVLSSTGMRIAEPWTKRLDDDLRPGNPVRAVVRVELPKQPGDYVLRLRLVQHGEGSLDRCGTIESEVRFASG